MNNLKKLAFVSMFVLTISTFSTSAQAYRCGWGGGQRVCWHENTTVYHVYPRAESRSYVVYTNERPIDRGCYWVNGNRVCR